MSRSMWVAGAIAVACAGSAQVASAAVLQFGDADMVGFGAYISDPTAGAALEGLGAGKLTKATNKFAHKYDTFGPSAGDFAGTDRPWVGSAAAAIGDGYSGMATRAKGPATFSLDYSSLIGAGQTIESLTLGIAADDFMAPIMGNPFVARINGAVDAGLTAAINSLQLSGVKIQFFSIGISVASLANTHTLTLEIDELGDGDDGFAVDFLTVGVKTSAPVFPAAAPIPGLGAAGVEAPVFAAPIPLAALGGLQLAGILGLSRAGRGRRW